jgi:hypothetical protein
VSFTTRRPLPAELAALGDFVVAACGAVGATGRHGDYVPVLLNVASREREAVVPAAVDHPAEMEPGSIERG